MPLNVFDFNKMITDFMSSEIKSQFPTIDSSEQSVFADMFAKPMASLFRPIIAELNSMEIRSNLENAQYMTDDDLDAIGTGNFLIPRNFGQEATATITLSFATVSNSVNLVVPAGVIFSTPSSLKFQLSNRIELTPQELFTMYNPQTMQYDVDIAVKALDVGAKYNVAQGQINKCESVFNNSLVSVTNKSAAIGGTDKENNVDYAARIREYYVSRHLGTPYGYRQYIFENFQEVTDAYISGYGDKYMTRDIITVVDPVTKNTTTRSIGGKVDIYIKGSNLKTTSTSVQLNSNNMVLSTKTTSIVPETTKVINETDLSKVPIWNMTTNADGNAVIVMVNTSNQSFDSTIVNNIYVKYTILAADGVTRIDKMEYFSVGVSSVELQHPFKDILNVQDTATSKTYNANTNYTIIKSGIVGTSQEVTRFVFSNAVETIPNGHMFTIAYTINDTINNMDKMFNVDENRIVTTDILFKEAQATFVNIAFRIRLLGGKKLDSVSRNVIQTSVSEFFKQCKLGQQVQESDIVGWLYKDPNTNGMIDFVALPFISFYISTNPQDALQPKRDGTYLNMEGIQYPVINKIEITDL